MRMKIFWWNGPQEIKAIKSEESRPTVERQNFKPPNWYIHSSTKVIHTSIDIMDVHNSDIDFNSVMDIHNSTMYIHNLITDIQTCIMAK